MTEWRNADKVFNFKFGVISFRTQILSLSYHIGCSLSSGTLSLRSKMFVQVHKYILKVRVLCFIFLSTLSLWYGSLLNIRKGEE